MREHIPAPDSRHAEADHADAEQEHRQSSPSRERRRTALDAIAAADTPLSLYQLAEEVAYRESAGAVTTTETDTVESIAVTLHHIHLPKLDDMDAIEYDPMAHHITV